MTNNLTPPGRSAFTVFTRNCSRVRTLTPWSSACLLTTGIAQLALSAIYAGKDVYLQKPMTMTHRRGNFAAARPSESRIASCRLRSQQRSWGPNEQFRKACEFVRSGRVGQLKQVEIGLPIDPTAPDDPPQPVPENLNYERWLGPTPEVYYHRAARASAKSGCEWKNRTSARAQAGCCTGETYCLGMITGWGAHHFDTAHWGMNMELTSGPGKVEGTGEFPKNKIWNVSRAFTTVELIYPGDIRLTVSDKFQNGIKFIGDDGWIFVCRDGTATASDPTGSGGALKWLDASDPKLLDPNGVTVQIPTQPGASQKTGSNVWKSRPDAADARAHRASDANAACIVSWIAMKLARSLTWDAKAEKFVSDDEANAMLSRPERAPYGATRLAKSHA